MVIMTDTSAYASGMSNESKSVATDEVQNDLQLGSYTENYESTPEELSKAALVNDIISDSSKSVEDLKNVILEKSVGTEGMSKRIEIDNVGYFSNAVKLKYPEMSDLDLGRTVLLALGDSEEFIATLPEDKIIEALGYSSVVKTESYYKETAEGEKIELSESEYYSEITLIDDAKIASENLLTNNKSFMTITPTSLSSPVYDKPEVLDSYIKLTSTAYKTNPSYALPGRNYFTIRGEVEWTKSPYFRGKDVLAIASSGNADTNYTSFAGACWDASLLNYVNETAYIGQNNGKGEGFYGYALKIYNPSIYGVAVDVIFDLNGYGNDLQFVYAYYGISTQNDVTCQVGYAHKTVGIGDPSVGIDSSGSISFSIGLVSTMNEYFGKAFTLSHESYSVILNSPSNNASINYKSAAPTFQWSLQNGLPKNYILEIDYLKDGSYMSIQVNNYHTLSAANWNKIVNDSPFTGKVKEIRWRIRINYTIYPSQQPYYSEWNTFTITGVPLTSQETLPTISGGARYTEKVINLGAGGYKDFFVTFATAGSKLIQTFGTKDTIIELYDANGRLVDADDDGGIDNNALLRIELEANTQYRIRVYFFSSSAYGNTKLFITPTQWLINSGSKSINKFEDIWLVENRTSYALNTSLTLNNTKVFRFVAPSTGTYTFETTGDYDSYVYVIDPQSSQLLTSSDYNDDGGEKQNALLTKKLTAGKTYLVFYSAYNIQSQSSVGSIQFKISFK